MDGLYETEFTWKLKTGVEVGVLAQGEIFSDFQGIHCGKLKLAYDFDAQWISDIVMKQVWEEEEKIGDHAVELLCGEAESAEAS